LASIAEDLATAHEARDTARCAELRRLESSLMRRSSRLKSLIRFLGVALKRLNPIMAVVGAFEAIDGGALNADDDVTRCQRIREADLDTLRATTFNLQRRIDFLNEKNEVLKGVMALLEGVITECGGKEMYWNSYYITQDNDEEIMRLQEELDAITAQLDLRQRIADACAAAEESGNRPPPFPGDAPSSRDPFEEEFGEE